MIDALLGPWKWLLYAALIAGAIGSVIYAKHSYDDRRREEGAEPYKVAIANQKQEAAKLLASETAKAEKVTQGWIDYSRKADNDYAKNVAAIRNAPIGGGLYDPSRRWANSNCPATSPGNTGTPENSAESSRLSGVSEQFLYAEAKRADEVAEYAMSCYRYVNAIPSVTVPEL